MSANHIVTALRLIGFIALSAGAVWLSWRSFRNPHSHGFFRFFVFESILILFLLNIDGWFREPFSAFQMVSWLLLTLSLLLAIHGFYLLHVIGQPEGPVEHTTILVKQGAYRYIRHPLYSSLLLLAWGVFFKRPSVISGALALTASVFLFATARAEEIECLHKFGDDYAAYMQTTKRFIPFLF